MGDIVEFKKPEKDITPDDVEFELKSFVAHSGSCAYSRFIGEAYRNAPKCDCGIKKKGGG